MIPSRTQRQAIVADAIRRHPDWSVRRVAKETGACRTLVDATRRAMLERGEIFVPRRIRGGDGKSYPAAPKVRATSQPRSDRVVRAVRRLTQRLDDNAWLSADRNARRRIWLAAEQLVKRTRELANV